ncbi:MAG TPA: hypothetical protein VF514_08540 [Bacteroidota bacterium]
MRSLPHAGACVCALLFVFLWQAEGCRDSATGPSPQSPQTVSGLVFAPGDSLIFDAWDLDSFGSYIVPSHRSPLWRVSAVSDKFAGAGNVTSITEYPDPVTFPAKSDTLHFQFLPSGDIYQYGFIAGVVARREGVHLVPSWDRIAALSLPTNATWTVGTVDSGGTDILRGTVTGDQGYFIAVLNGVRTVFHGYGVSLSSLDIDYSIVVSDVPPAVLLVREESTPLANGFLRYLASLTKH